VFAASLFVVFTWLAKEVPSLYVHEPWQDDPYDAFVSMAIWCVPLLTGLSVLRVLLCRRFAPLPARRALDLLRVSRVVMAATFVVLAADWVSVALRARASAYTATTTVLVCALGVVTASAVVASLQLRRARRRFPATATAPPQPDWVADALLLGEREAARLGRWREPAVGLLRWVDRAIVARARARPIGAAALFSVVFAVGIDSAQIALEGYPPLLAVWFVSVSACSVFAVCGPNDFRSNPSTRLACISTSKPPRDVDGLL
jgi:hypothetical protein